MANKKRRCTSCKKYKEAISGIVSAIGFFCDSNCRYEYVNKNAKAVIEKSRDITHKAKKKAYNENKLSTRKRATKEACHEYIRLRDKNEPCICCGEPLGDDYHAGHFQESGNNPKLRYDEDNIHGQRSSCNTFKGGDSGFYKENLIKKIGVDRVNRLLENKGGTVKRTAQDYREIEAYYKDLIKKMPS